MSLLPYRDFVSISRIPASAGNVPYREHALGRAAPPPMRSTSSHAPEVRSLLRGLALVAATAACSPVPAAPPAPPPPPPNVLMVVLDTTRADHCGFVGYGRETTPVIDRLASQGVAFTNAWSPAGWTGPAHGSLFTGLRPENHHMWMGERPDLSADWVTLAESLRDAGYATGAWSCNGFVSHQFGLLQGFDTAEMVLGADRSVEYLGRRAQERASAWISGQTGPWFAFLNVMEPHIPYAPPWTQERRFVAPDVAPQRLAALRALDFPVTIEIMLGLVPLPEDDLRVLRDLYDAELATADEAILPLIETVHSRGELDRTIVVIAGDHGENLGEHGLLSHRFSLHKPIRHVPLLLRYPPAFPAGRVERRTVRLEDVFPTVLDLCDLSLPHQVDGASLTGDVGTRIARAIQGPIPPEFQARLAVLLPDASLGRFAQGIRAVYDGHHHLIRFDDGREELYDVREDPGETRDLSATHPGVADRLREQLPEPKPH